MENTVEQILAGSVQDDAAQAQQENTQPLSEFMTEQKAQTQPEAPAPKEPGWIKQRVSAAVDKAVAEAEARVAARYEAMLAPMRESLMDREAQELFASGEFKTLERAKEYVRLKNGVPVTQEESQPQKSAPERDAQGRFVKQEQPSDPVTQAKADLLAKQAQKIMNTQGVDVMAAFQSDPNVQAKVLSGEWDFYDVAQELTGRAGRRAPAPVYSPNSAGNQAGLSVANMSDEQFDRLNQSLASGRRYDMR